MATINLGELGATTLLRRENMIADNVTDNVALLAYLKSKGRIKNDGGGRKIVEPLIYAENGSYKWYNGLETWTIALEDVVDASQYDRALAAAFVYFSGEEKLANRGKWEAVNLVEARIKAAQATMANKWGTALYDGNPANKEIVGLNSLIAVDPTAAGTIGGIDQTSNPFWRNQVKTGALPAEMTSEMNKMYLATKRGVDAVQVIAAGYTAYEAYWEKLQAIQRITKVSKGAAGFQVLEYMGADVLADELAPAKTMFFLNLDYLSLQMPSDRRWKADTKRTVPNADYDLIPILSAGALCTSNRSLQGRIDLV